MRTLAKLFLIILVFTITSCSLPTTTDSDRTPTPLAEIVPVTVTEDYPPTATTIKPTPTTIQVTPAVPTATVQPTPEATSSPLPIPTQESVQTHTFTGDCKSLERPLVHTHFDAIHEFTSLTTNDRCTLQLANEERFTFGNVMTKDGIFGARFANNVAQLVRINFDGTVSDPLATVGGFYSGEMLVSAETDHIVWADGDGDQDNTDQFIAKLWIADKEGNNAKVIYEHTTDLTQLLNEIFIPIGFLPNGDVLFSIEPAGRGGGWAYTGEHTNLYRTSIDSAEKHEEDLIFSCPDKTPFCVGAFTPDFSHFVSIDREEQTIQIVETDTGSQTWSTTIKDRTFIGQPRFNADKDLAFIAVDVIDEGSLLRPENGYIGLLDFPYENPFDQVQVELATDVIAWVNNNQILYYELTANLNGERRFPIIDRTGKEVGSWESAGRFPVPVR